MWLQFVVSRQNKVMRRVQNLKCPYILGQYSRFRSVRGITRGKPEITTRVQHRDALGRGFEPRDGPANKFCQAWAGNPIFAIMILFFRLIADGWRYTDVVRWVRLPPNKALLATPSRCDAARNRRIIRAGRRTCARRYADVIAGGSLSPHESFDAGAFRLCAEGSPHIPQSVMVAQKWTILFKGQNLA